MQLSSGRRPRGGKWRTKPRTVCRRATRRPCGRASRCCSAKIAKIREGDGGSARFRRDARRAPRESPTCPTFNVEGPIWRGMIGADTKQGETLHICCLASLTRPVLEARALSHPHCIRRLIRGVSREFETLRRLDGRAGLGQNVRLPRSCLRKQPQRVRDRSVRHAFSFLRPAFLQSRARAHAADGHAPSRSTAFPLNRPRRTEARIARRHAGRPARAR